MIVCGRSGPTNDITTGCKACTLGENFLLAKFKMAAGTYPKILFSVISQLLVDTETRFWWQNICFCGQGIQ